MLGTLRKVLSASMLVVALAAPPTASALTYDRLIFFGDSLADTGTNAFVLDSVVDPVAPPGTLRTPVPIPGPDFIPTFPYASSNRYSNGPVWPEHFAAYAGPGYARDAQPALLGGSNFAYGGARMGPRGSTLPENIGDQVGTYLSTTGGMAVPGALHVVQGTGNDARDALSLLGRGGDPAPAIAAYVADTISVLSQLYAAGAGDILLVNVPDIGEAPAIQILGPGAVNAATMIAAAMNAGVDTALSVLPAQLRQSVRELDLFELVNRVVTDPGAFGLTDVRTACAVDPACIANPATTFFWDGVHPTTAGHDIIARAAFAAAVPEPATLALFAVGFLGFALAQAKRLSRV